VDTERLLESGERGIHLLFDNRTIAEAYAQDPVRLEGWVRSAGEEVEQAILGLLAQPDATAGRAFVAGLPAEPRSMLVLLYFELLDDRLRRRRVLH